MKIAKLKSSIQASGVPDSIFWDSFAFPVDDDFDFDGDKCDDITSVHSLLSLWNYSNKIDYLTFRDSCKLYFKPTAIFNSLPFEDRKILVQYFVYPVGTDIQKYFSTQEETENWIELTKITKPERTNRVELCRRTLSFYINGYQSIDLYLSVAFYMQAFEEAQAPHLVLWLTNGKDLNLITPVDFTDDGFKQKSYYSDELRDLCVNIIVNGKTN